MKQRFWMLFFFAFSLTTLLLNCQKKPSVSVPALSEKQVVDTLIQQSIDARDFAPNSIVSLADSSIQLAKQIAYLEGELNGLYQKAIGYFFQSQYQKAEENCHFILEKLEGNPSIDSLIRHNKSGSAYTLLGLLKQKQGEYESAVPLLLKALDHFEIIRNSGNMASVFTNLSENFRFIKNFEKAIFYNKKGEEYYLKANQPKGIITVLQNRGSIFYDQNNFQAALDIFELTLEKAKAENDFGNMVNAINNIGSSYEEMGKNEIAMQNYLTAIEMYQEREDYWGEANTLGNISMIHLKMDQIENAIRSSNNALSISKEHNFLELEKFNTENLAKIYERRGNFVESLKLYKQVQLLQDSLYNQQKFETINLLEQQFNEEQSNRIIAQKDKAIVESQLQSNRLQSLITLLGIIFLAVLSGAWLLYRQAKFRKEKNQELLQKNAIIQNQNDDLESFINAYESQKEKFIKIGNQQIQLDDIIYIRYQDRISSIFLKDQSIVEHRTQLSQLMSELNYKSHFLFSQINQNYIVHFKNIDIQFHDGEDEKYFFTHFLPNDSYEGRNEDFIKTRKRSGLNKIFEREYQRYLRLKEMLD